jgi:NADH-quinone oxidoreductase subunit M
MPTDFFQFDSLNLAMIAVFAAIGVVTLLAAPRRDLEGPAMAGLVVIVLGTLLAYSAGNLYVFLAGWTMTYIPFLAGWFPRDRASIAMSLIGIAALGLGVALADWNPTASFVLFMAAVVCRKGLFPSHFLVTSAFENGSIVPMSLLLNGHLGAFLVARFAIPLFPSLSRDALGLISMLALLTSVYTALLAIGSQRPRRTLALLCVSQAAFVLAGLESRNQEGIAGALLLALVTSVASMGLVLVYRAMEVRYASVASPQDYLGLAGRAPRFATFFAIFGLALVGLPGTLGFAAEDLLFHGALESHPLLGIALPIATAMNAITFIRLFSRLFLGRQPSLIPYFPDARPGERFAMATLIAALVVTGIFPRAIVSLRAAAASDIVTALGGPDQQQAHRN